MFKVGDKVQDTSTRDIGEVSKIRFELGEFPVVVDFGENKSAYDIRGFHSIRKNNRRIKLINLKPEEITPVSVEITQTFIQIKEDDTTTLLPLASTSFKIKHNIIIATHNNKEYTICIPEISQIINKLLNPTKNELL